MATSSANRFGRSDRPAVIVLQCAWLPRPGTPTIIVIIYSRALSLSLLFPATRMSFLITIALTTFDVRYMAHRCAPSELRAATGPACHVLVSAEKPNTPKREN